MRVAATIAFALLALLPLSAVTVTLASTPDLVERTVYLMGTRATLVLLATDRATGMRRLEGMVRSLERTEAELSTWRTDSVLSTVNRQPVGEPFQLPAPICALWGELTTWHQATEGAFDPAVRAVADAWGLRESGRHPSPEELAAARAVTGLAHFDFDASTCRVTRVVDATLDAGAFGKGVALRRLLLQSDAGAAWMVDLGGQIAVSGTLPTGPWPVAIAHPARRAETTFEVALDGGSLATSGASERSHEVDGGTVAHLLDPRTGRPLHRSESVTVWHEDALVADVLSTALYVMGLEAGLRFADENGISAVFLAPSNGRVGDAVTPNASRAFRRRFWEAGGTGK
ncbi:MAG: FAD:protein FMN transferase [Vicinamibacterales bacterium]|jgi:thiamine biosynthesis lipoprotein|nr:FAD:protein FMN transferase [Vicinamibacterales bacterium]